MENWGSEDDKMSRRVWEAVEAEVRKVRMAETKGRRTEEGRRQKARRKVTKERRRKEKDKTKESKGNECKKGSRRMRNLG